MCGFLVAVTRPGALELAAVEYALREMRHRGPDASRVEVTQVRDWDIWLGHQRLAIQDLDVRANQPMSFDGMSIVYNGEVYNGANLRAKLEPRDWVSSSDTEILLASLSARGPTCLGDVNGMFAFACFEKIESRITLARDRLGQKPLYLLHSEELFVAASELKAIYAIAQALSFHLHEDQEAFAHYRWLGYLPFASTPYREIRRFRAATWSTFELRPDAIVRTAERCYWDPFAHVASGFPRSRMEAREACAALLDDATVLRTVSDRPVGVFLSGGIDSTLVATSLAKVKKDALVISVESPGFDESNEAAQTARTLGLPFRRVVLNEEAYARQQERLADVFDEPFSDQSSIPLMALCEEAVRDVTVALTGDGGDEPFLGYPWQTFPERVWKSNVGLVARGAARWPPARTALARLLASDAGASVIARFEQMFGRNPETAQGKALIAEALLSATSAEWLYDAVNSAQPPSTLPACDQAQLRRPLLKSAKEFYPEYSWGAFSDRPLCEQLAALDLVTYLRDGILVKADRSSMAYSMELRSPFLDHRLVEFGFSLPIALKVSGTMHKLVLRDLLRSRLTGEIADRPKSGFGVALPDELPSASTPRGRWTKYCEEVWRRRWLTR